MSRLNSPAPVVVAPTHNVYTAMALIAFLATLGAVVFMVMRFKELGLILT